MLIPFPRCFFVLGILHRNEVDLVSDRVGSFAGVLASGSATLECNMGKTQREVWPARRAARARTCSFQLSEKAIIFKRGRVKPAMRRGRRARIRSKYKHVARKRVKQQVRTATEVSNTAS